MSSKLTKAIWVILFIAFSVGIIWYDEQRPAKETFTLQRDKWECTERKTSIANVGGRLLNTTKCVNYHLR